MNKDDDNLSTTHFGYQTVSAYQKEIKVAEVFSNVAPYYDVMNDLMSFGIHRLWKRFTLECAHIQPGQHILDLAGGSGDLTRLFYQRIGKSGSITLADINYAMIQQGKKRLLDLGIYRNLHFVEANAESLPFKKNCFDCVTMAFGLRNVTNKSKALSSIFEVCRPGGKIMILEFSTPAITALAPIYDWYSFKILPNLGQWIAGDSANYQYLAESIRMHPNQTQLSSMITQAGFEDCYYVNLCGGIVALHIAYKY